MAVEKIIELVGNSQVSWEDAAHNALSGAAKSLHGITGMEIVELILKLQRTYGTSSIIISHDMHVARLAANRIAMLHEGRNYLEGTFDEFHASKDPLVKKFFIFM